MPKSSVFIFELDCKEKEDLEKEIFENFNKLKINLEKPLPWEGFLKKKNTNELIHNKDEFGINRFTYGIEEEKEDESINGEMIINRVKYFTPVWVDLSSKLLFIFNSDSGLAHRIVRQILSVNENKLDLEPFKLKGDFFKWLEDIEDYGDSILIKILGTRAIGLKEIDGISESLSLTTYSMLNKSQIFLPIKDKGSRVYLKGIFKINGNEINASFYTQGKITISKKESLGMSFDEAKHSIKEIYKELKEWYKKWEESKEVSKE